MTLPLISCRDAGFDEKVAAVGWALRAGCLTGSPTGQLDVAKIVRDVIADVEARGDEALIDLTAKIEKVALAPDRLRVSAQEITARHVAAEPEFLELIRRVIANIREYQQSILVRTPAPLQRGSRELGVRYTPIDRVGVYVPGGTAVLISTALMTVVPAQVAGVGQIALVSPPTSDGDISPMVLAVACELGVEEVYRVSGTAGVAALAIGTETIRAADKIVGPGNAFIAEAKRQLFGRVGIDSVAGPSEVLIIADESANPSWVAADMLAQAEHNPGSAVLVTPSEKLAGSVAAAVEEQLGALDRATETARCLDEYGAIIVTADISAACDLANDFAAEHLQIVTRDDEGVLQRIRNAGAIFIGSHTPVPLGDYYAGPSHVLPTGGTARFFGPLSCNDFRKASSVLRYDAAALADDAADTIDFACREGLTAHARAVEIREHASSEGE